MEKIAHPKEVTLEAVADFENLSAAYTKAKRGKTKRHDVSVFSMKWESHLLQLSDSLLDGTYRPSAYRVFVIHEKKTRTIMAALFKDRIVHHAVCNVVSPVLERSMVRSTCANRVGLGTKAALILFSRFSRKYRYVLKCDIKTFFPSIDREILLNLLRKKVPNKDLLKLISLILFAAPQQDSEIQYFPGDNLLTPIERKKGLPIGNMTSQTWANWYLNGLDHFLCDYKGFGSYVRYLDDFALFSDNKPALNNLKNEIREYLCGLRLCIHENKSQVYRTDEGVPFLGYRHFSGLRRLIKPNIRRFKKRIRKRICEGILVEKLTAIVAGWSGYARMGNTYLLRKTLAAKLGNYLKGRGKEIPRCAWGLVEQQSEQPSVRVSEQQQSGQP